jgi:hypothetical protein
MAQDLERLTRGVQMAAAGRLRRPGRIVTRDLRRKEALGWRNWVWIFNAEVGMAISLIFLASFIMVLNTWWGQLIPMLTGWFGVVISLAAFAACGALSYMRSDPPSSGHLSHEKRKEAIEGERSRRKAPHAPARRARQPELEFNYYQYSVDVRYEKREDKIVLRLLEHRPWKDGRYLSDVYTPSSREMAMVSNGNGDKGRQLTAERWLQTSGEISDTMDDVYRHQQLMEALAEALEEERYTRELQRLQHQRIALMARR